MEVTALIVNFNGRELLPDCLNSLPSDMPVVVVDNHSQDESLAYLESASGNITVIKNTCNRGFGRANNQGLEHVMTPYALLINTDARLDTPTLSHALDYMKQHPQTALIGARLKHPDGREQNGITWSVDLMSECLNRNLVAWWRGERRKSLRSPGEVPAVVGPCLLVRMEAMRRVGGFDEDYFFFFEETDLCRRLNAAGTPVVHHPEFVAFHLGGGSAKKRWVESRIEYHISRQLFFFKHFGRQAAKQLHLWQQRRLWLTHLGQQLIRLLTLGLITPRKTTLTRELLHWYRLGCPSNRGLDPSRRDTIDASVSHS